MINYFPEDIGRYVIYKPEYGKTERGRIKSANSHYVFVVYHCDNDWENYQNYTGCATNPEDLEYEVKEVL